ncbi:DUF4956 domain-containing protein [Balneolaceae bacterium ANBcel3]|nr:DUF4956 domain-containing protein [Balneolaceae bacterium ANBcel3]
MSDWFFLGDVAPLPTNFQALLMGLFLAFLCGQMLAMVYMVTHSGLSYSRTYVSSLVLIPVTVAMVMMVLDNNLVTAFSLMAVFAIVRFRNIVRDTLDTVYILSLIVLGMACGTQKYTTALIGTLTASTVLVYLYYTSFGSRQRYDLILNLRWTDSLKNLIALEKLLERHALKVHMASQRSGYGEEGADLSFRLLMRDPARVQDLLDELNNHIAVSKVTTMKADEESEV